MIIDIHAHVVAAPELYQWQATLLASRGAHGFVPKRFTDDFIRDHPETRRNLRIMDEVGTDVQLLSPRPYQLMHSEKPLRMVESWAVANHNYIAQQVALYPERFRGVCGLPQAAGEPVTFGLPELERCVNELGFVGTLIDTDPGEGDNSTPTLGDRYWYPLWEKMVELDIPGLVHSTGCKHGRETYSQHFISEESLAVLSLINSDVFDDFQNLKIVVSHGGGSVPYQIGRWRANYALFGGKTVEAFNEKFSKLYFDTCLHNRNSLELLIALAGSQNVLFGTENPGSGSVPDPETGRTFDDLRPLIEEIDGLAAEELQDIFENNARRLYGRLSMDAPGR